MRNKILTFVLVFAILLPVTGSALSVGWDRYIVGGLRQLYPQDNVVIGSVSTSTNSRLEVNGTTTATLFVATSTQKASQFPYASSTALSSNFWFGGGLGTCNGSDFLQWTGGQYGCATAITSPTPPGGDDTQVQFNNAGSFGGTAIIYNPDFFGNATDVPSFETPTGGGSYFGLHGGDATASSDVDGDGFFLMPGNGDGTGDGGGVFIGGQSNWGNGGDTGNGGPVQIQGGGGGPTSGAGGSISLTAGSAQGGDSDGGSIGFIAGAGSGAGTSGTISFSSANDTTALSLTDDFFTILRGNGGAANLSTALIVSDNRTFSFPDLDGAFLVGSTTEADGDIGIGTTTPVGRFHATKGPAATTTISFAEIGINTSKTCINMNRSNGAPASMYINAAGSLVIESIYCR